MHKLAGILVIILIFLSINSAGLPQPVGIIGRVKINGVYQDGIQITVKNLNTGEEKVVTTQEINGEHGWYLTTLFANNNDVLQINYGQHTNQTTVDLDRLSQYLNLSVTTESGGGESSSPSEIPHVIPSPPPPPHANFTYSPSNPKVGDEVTFIDTSEGNITSRTWTIDGNSFTTKTVTYTFTLPGYYDISLVIMDAYGNVDIAQQTIFISTSEQSFEANETNNTNPPQKTNVTLYITVKSRDNRTIPNAKVEIYDKNNTLVQIVYTNDTGTAQATLPAGSYKIKAYYGTQTETKRMEFVNDGRVVFLFNPEEIPSEEGGFDWWLIAIPLILILVIFVVWRWRKSKKWW